MRESRTERDNGPVFSMRSIRVMDEAVGDAEFHERHQEHQREENNRRRGAKPTLKPTKVYW